MNRRLFFRYVPGLLGAPLAIAACERGASQAATEGAEGDLVTSLDSLRVHPPIGDFEPLDKPLETWQELLTGPEFNILFQDGTEPRFSSELLEVKERGTYICAACYLPLFPSTTKYESGTGWPSFWKPLDGVLGEEEDTRFGMVRTEYHCARCGGHQGHVFLDGPEPTGLRYCNNGLALDFVLEGEPLPALRS